jgi:hypothetical protein
MPENISVATDTPQGVEAQTTPTSSIKSDTTAYLFQEIEYVRQAITDMRMQMVKDNGEIRSELQTEVKKAVDTCINLSKETKSDNRVFMAEVKGYFDLTNESVKSIVKSNDELKPKVENLILWKTRLIGIAVGAGAIVAVLFTYLPSFLKNIKP